MPRRRNTRPRTSTLLSRVTIPLIAAAGLSAAPAHGELLDVRPETPATSFDTDGTLAFDSTTRELTLRSTHMSIQFDAAALDRLVLPTGNPPVRFVELTLQLDDSGRVIPGSPGTFVVVGEVDEDGDGEIDAQGTLLSGKPVAFGWKDGASANGNATGLDRGKVTRERDGALSGTGETDSFDVIIELQTGALATDSSLLGMRIVAGNSTFRGNFAANFTGTARGTVGPTDPMGACCYLTTCIELNAESCDLIGGSFTPAASCGALDGCNFSSASACCYPDGSCADFVKPDACTEAGGTSVYNVCKNIVCLGLPTGACCIAGGICLDDVLEPDCHTLGGTPFVDMPCAAVECPSSNGACCLSTDVCFEISQLLCEAAGGTFGGVGTPCNTFCLSEYAGACCLANDECVLAEPGHCETLGGTFVNQPCEGMDCLTSGACCLPDGTCIFPTNFEACAVQGGHFQGHDVMCADIDCLAACCYGDTCVDLSPAQCAQTLGIFAGSDTSCADFDCTGACCFEDGTCCEVDETTCTNTGGTFDNGMTCADIDCGSIPTGALPGACCYDDGDCCQLGELYCTIAGGTWLGFNSSCDACVVVGGCCFGVNCEDGYTADECLDAGGTYLGDAVECVDGECCITIDFETEDDYGPYMDPTPIVDGQSIESFELEYGTYLDFYKTFVGFQGGGSATRGLAAYNSNGGGNDEDLDVGQGNVLILQYAFNDDITGDVFDTADDSAFGGEWFMAFKRPVRLSNIDIIDVDDGPNEGVHIVIVSFDGSGYSLGEYNVPAGWTGDGAVRTLDLSNPHDQPGAGGVPATFELIEGDFDPDEVVGVFFECGASVAFDNIDVCAAGAATDAPIDFLPDDMSDFDIEAYLNSILP